jgi:RNA polymerase sigma factor (sigma-70 family)
VADDAELVERSRRDPEQFAAVVERHGPCIHRYLARRVGRDLADDLTAETFLVAFARRRDYDLGYKNAAPWLYGIATRIVGQHRRQEVRQLRIHGAVAPEPDEPDHAGQVAAHVTARTLREPLARAIAGLPRGERDALLLVAWELLSYDDTARALGIPAGTVRSRLNRARGRLRPVFCAAALAATVEEVLSND